MNFDDCILNILATCITHELFESSCIGGAAADFVEYVDIGDNERIGCIKEFIGDIGAVVAVVVGGDIDDDDVSANTLVLILLR